MDIRCNTPVKGGYDVNTSVHKWLHVWEMDKLRAKLEPKDMTTIMTLFLCCHQPERKQGLGQRVMLSPGLSCWWYSRNTAWRKLTWINLKHLLRNNIDSQTCSNAYGFSFLIRKPSGDDYLPEKPGIFHERRKSYHYEFFYYSNSSPVMSGSIRWWEI